MEENKFNKLLLKQREFFNSGYTLDINNRIRFLKNLYCTIKSEEPNIYDALKADLNKSETESYMCEVGMVLSELSYMISHVKKFAKDNKVKTPLSQIFANSYIKKSPYGNVLIMSPWNYPFLLTIGVIVDAVAAGNTVIAKPSAYSKNTSKVIKIIVKKVFKEEWVTVIEGGRVENKQLLDLKFDKIFFTGSVNVGKEVMRSASKNLIPITLELGGKSPCIVDETANISLAAKRIIFGKLLNCGQTCVAPDYIYVHKSKKEELINELKREIISQYGDNAIYNPNYVRIINEKHFNRIISLIDDSKVVYGGDRDVTKLKIQPTIMDNVSWNDKIMQEEIFGPVLPILEFNDIKNVEKLINSYSYPLALYLFSSSKSNIKWITEHCKFGGGCINDTVIHIATPYMGFGGVGESGMGRYHGKAGFDCFSYEKNIVDKKNFFDLSIRYQPYKDKNKKIIKYFMK